MKWIAVTILSVVVALLAAAVPDARQRTISSAGIDEKRADSRLTSRKIDVNVASIRELQRLPGIGAELAQRVAQHRPYRSLDELIVKKVLGRKQFARIKERIRVNSTLEKKAAPFRTNQPIQKDPES